MKINICPMRKKLGSFHARHIHAKYSMNWGITSHMHPDNAREDNSEMAGLTAEKGPISRPMHIQTRNEPCTLSKQIIGHKIMYNRITSGFEVES